MSGILLKATQISAFQKDRPVEYQARLALDVKDLRMIFAVSTP